MHYIHVKQTFITTQYYIKYNMNIGPFDFIRFSKYSYCINTNIGPFDFIQFSKYSTARRKG